MEKKTIGNLIKTRRKEKGLSQKQLAELLLVSDTTISKWETGVNLPDVLILKRIAEVLNIPLTEFLEVDDKASVDDAASTSGNRESHAEEEPEADAFIPTDTEIIDSPPEPLPRDPPAREKSRWPKQLIFVLSCILIGTVIIGYLTLGKKGSGFSLELCEEYQGDYEGKNAYYIIVEYSKELTDEEFFEHGNIIRSSYEEKFVTSDILVIIYVTDYDNYKKKGFDDITDSYSILYP